MQWYKRWATIRDRFISLPDHERAGWWQRWDELGVSPWDQHESGGMYNPQGTLFDLACHHDPQHLGVLLAAPVAPEDVQERQSSIDRACYEAWHRGDAAVFDRLSSHVQPWAAWVQRLRQGSGNGGTRVMLPGPASWIEGQDHHRDHPALGSEEVALLTITAGQPDTKAWPLWAARYAGGATARAALDHLWTGSSTGRVLENLMTKVEDPRWALWAVRETRNPDRFSEGAGEPLIHALIARIAVVALPRATTRPTAAVPSEWFDAQLQKLDGLIESWGMPATFDAPLPMGNNRQGDAQEALQAWKASGHPALQALVGMIERQWLRQALNEEGPSSTLAAFRPRL